MKKTAEKKSNKEFILLMAMMTSIMALAIDTMLPAMSTIGKDLHIIEQGSLQYIITILFLSFGIGQLVFGPLSDSIGRKKPIYIGGTVFIIGCITSFYSTNLETMLIGRFFQGFGAAAFRTISIAIIRDQYEGNTMAEVISLVMTVFILVPVFAPAIGQGIIAFSSWRMIFLIFTVLTTIILIWFFIRQIETLHINNRKAFSFKTILRGCKETITNPTSAIATLTSGLIFGGFIAYLSTAQQIFQNLYQVGQNFPLYFGGLAFTIGLSSFANSRLVKHFGIITLIKSALGVMCFSSLIFLSYLFISDLPAPPLAILMTFFTIFFACVGLLFGNLNTLALAPLGHIAGVASSVVGSIQNFISVSIGVSIASSYTNSVFPIILGFACMSSICLILVLLGFKKHYVIAN